MITAISRAAAAAFALCALAAGAQEYPSPGRNISIVIGYAPARFLFPNQPTYH